MVDQGQQIFVQVPPGAASGTILQVQGPKGPFNVMIPEGLGAGATFGVLPPT